MVQNRKKDAAENYFGSLPTVHIYAEFKNGRFIDLETESEVTLKNGAIVRMITLSANVPDEEYTRYTDVQRKKVLPEGTTLFIRMPIVNEGEFQFVIKLKETLIMKKAGNKEAVAEPCRCDVIDRIENGFIKNLVKFEPFEAGSLNQAFFQASVRYRPKNKSHATNIYQSCFLEDGRSISCLRF